MAFLGLHEIANFIVLYLATHDLYQLGYYSTSQSEYLIDEQKRC